MTLSLGGNHGVFQYGLKDVQEWMITSPAFQQHVQDLSRSMKGNEIHAIDIDNTKDRPVLDSVLVIAAQDFDAEKKQWVLAAKGMDPDQPWLIRQPIWISRYYDNNNHFSKPPIEIFRATGFAYVSEFSRGVDVSETDSVKLKQDKFLVQYRKENSREVNILISVKDFGSLI